MLSAFAHVTPGIPIGEWLLNSSRSFIMKAARFIYGPSKSILSLQKMFRATLSLMPTMASPYLGLITLDSKTVDTNTGLLKGNVVVKGQCQHTNVGIVMAVDEFHCVQLKGEEKATYAM